MLKDRIIATLQFFDFQNFPLTFLELHKYLLTEPGELAGKLDNNWNLQQFANMEQNTSEYIPVDDLLIFLEQDVSGKVENKNGFYFLKGRAEIVDFRLENYINGLKREKIIGRFAWMFKYLPFIRGVALAGSQSFGQQKSSSDIDLFVITDPEFLWLGRIFITFYLQIIGERRHGKKISDRFCLNHYLAGPQELKTHRDLYNAMEYLRFRPLCGGSFFQEFYNLNTQWLKIYFPNFEPKIYFLNQSSKFQPVLEKFFYNKFGRFLNKKLGQWQLWRIQRGEFIEANEKELAFHSLKRKKSLLESFFQLQKQNNGETIKPVI